MVIVEDHKLFAEAMDVALSFAGYDVRRVKVAQDPTAPGALVFAVVKQQPAVVLLDLDLGGFGDGGRVIEPITRAGAQVVVVTGSEDRARWGDAIRSGARKVQSKTEPLYDIIATVRRIMTGLPVMDREERDELVSESTRRRQELHGLKERLEQLTVRESAVLGHLMKGRAVRQIAGHQCGVRGDGAHPGEVDPVQARGVLAAGRGGHGPRDRLARAARLLRSMLTGRTLSC